MTDRERDEEFELKQKKTCEAFILNVCNRIENINYRKTSYTWAKEVERWAGRIYYPWVWHRACEKNEIPFLEVSPGVYCYKLEIKK